MTISPESITDAIRRRDLEALPITDNDLLELEEAVIDTSNDDLAGQFLHLLNQLRLCRNDVIVLTREVSHWKRIANTTEVNAQEESKSR
jgi:hypothetical protein